MVGKNKVKESLSIIYVFISARKSVQRLIDTIILPVDVAETEALWGANKLAHIPFRVSACD
jgi:hypothetical protein